MIPFDNNSQYFLTVGEWQSSFHRSPRRAVTPTVVDCNWHATRWRTTSSIWRTPTHSVSRWRTTSSQWRTPTHYLIRCVCPYVYIPVYTRIYAYRPKFGNPSHTLSHPMTHYVIGDSRPRITSLGDRRAHVDRLAPVRGVFIRLVFPCWIFGFKFINQCNGHFSLFCSF